MRVLIVMSSNHAMLFKQCYEEYEKRRNVHFEFLIYATAIKKEMSFLNYILFKYNLFQGKQKYYDKLRKELIEKAKTCDKVIAYNLYWDIDFLINDYVCDCLQGKDCSITFADPMGELCVDGVRQWSLFRSIFTFEYGDIGGYAKEKN